MRAMQLQTLARDSLSLNWALPLPSAPPLPKPLRYEVHRWQDEDYVFASALLFRLSGLHHRALPFLRLGYPQMSLRLYVIDHEQRPAVLLQRLLVPNWTAPGAKCLARQPAEGARLTFPVPRSSPVESWHWSVWSPKRKRGLEVAAELSSPQPSERVRLGSWNETLAYFRNRRRVYALWRSRLRALRTSHSAAEVWPVAIEIKDAGLIAACLDGCDEESLRRPHSAWLCPQIPFTFELGKALALPLPGQRWPAPESC